jgi:hypothetical protein
MNAELESIISQERLTTYLVASGFDRDRALNLYAWNMKVAAAFLPLLGAAEICSRNLIAARIEAGFGAAWWRHSDLHQLMGPKGKGIVLRAADKVRDSGKPETPGRVIAELSFGFWVNMLLPKYDLALWTPLHLRFTELPAPIDLGMLHARMSAVHELRNRIGHHEPIFRRNLSQDYADCLELIKWFNSAKARWIASHCDVQRMLRRKP